MVEENTVEYRRGKKINKRYDKHMEEAINIGEDIGADTEWKGYKEKEREMERRKGNKEERERERVEKQVLVEHGG